MRRAGSNPALSASNYIRGKVFTMMRAMILCLALAFVGVFVFLGIHYANEVGSEIMNTLKKLFG